METLSFDDLPGNADIGRAPLRVTVRPQGVQQALDRAPDAISSIESGGNYGAIGPATKDGDRAFGRYQVMGKNIPQWTQEATGTAMTPRQFLADPRAQDAVFRHQFGKYADKYGPEGAAKAWFAGERGMNNPDAADVNGMTVQRYGEKFTDAMGAQPPPGRVARGELKPPPSAQSVISFDDIASGDQAATFNERFGKIEQKAVDRGALDAFARAAGQGATFGFGDELRGMQAAGGGDARGMDDPAAVLRGLYRYWTGDKAAERAYTDTKRQAAWENAVAEAQHPIASVAGNVVGGTVATLPMAAFGAPAAGAGLAARALQGAKTGAAFGAAYGLGEGEGTERLGNAAIGAGVGAAAGGLVNAALGKRPVGPIDPKPSDIFATSKPYYREWEQAAARIGVPRETAAGIGDRLRGALDAKNLTPDLAEQVYRSVGILDRGAMTLADLQNVKRVIGRSFNSPDKNVRDAASIATAELTKVIREVAPDAAENLATADAIHASAKSLQTLQRKADIAGLRTGRAGYGGNAVNAMRQVLSPIVQRSIEGKTTGFRPHEIQAMRDIVEGAPATDMLRAVGQLSPSKGIMQTALAAGAYMTNKPTGLAVPMLGLAGNRLAAMLTRRQIDQLSTMVAKRSPAYAQAVSNATQRYINAQSQFAAKPSVKLFAAYLAASRALSSGLNKDGIKVTSGDLLRAIQGPVSGRADGEQNGPEGVIDEQP